MLPSRLQKHEKSANGLLSLLDAAARQRDQGDRKTMRLLSITAREAMRRWNKPARQLLLSF